MKIGKASPQHEGRDDLDPLDLKVEPIDLDFSAENLDIEAESFDIEPVSPEELAAIADPEAAIHAALALATPQQISSARKSVDWIERRLRR